jgi:hypothetical protein
MKTMKKILAIGIFVFAGIGSSLAQDKAIQDIFDKYNGKEGFTTVQLGNGALSFLSDLNKDDPDLKKMAEAMHSLKILIADETAPRTNFAVELKGSLNFNTYKELMTIREKDEDVQILVRESDGMISDLLVLVNGSDENVLISMNGRFHLKDFASMGSLRFEGMDHLKALKD